MWTAIIGVFGKFVGGIMKNLPTLAAYFQGKKAAKAEILAEEVKAEAKSDKIKNKNKKAKTSELLKKAKKYQRRKP